nr:hypothetical protein B0A51_09286 [Rachicladosporium sp. CCFEE 5018]
MSNSTTPNPANTPPAARPNRPLSEALLNEKWDHCLSTTLIRGTLGASFGIIFSVLLFKRRSWPVFTGAGFGIGRAWEECDAVSTALCKRVCTTRRQLEDLHTPLSCCAPAGWRDMRGDDAREICACVTSSNQRFAELQARVRTLERRTTSATTVGPMPPWRVQYAGRKRGIGVKDTMGGQREAAFTIVRHLYIQSAPRSVNCKGW